MTLFISWRPWAKALLPALAVVAATIAVVAAAAVAYAENADFQEGVAAYRRGDYETALAVFRTLALQEHIDAQNNLGVMYNNGHGVPQDYSEAAKWYLKAAQQGHVDSQSNVAALYFAGKGVPQDYVKAYAWFNLASAQGDERARKNRDYVSELMTPAQIDQANQLSLLTPATTPSPTTPPPPPAVATVTEPPTTTAETTKATTAEETATTAAKSITTATAETTIGEASTDNPAANAIVPTLEATEERIYGPVAQGETLWSIANKFAAGAAVSTGAMIAAIQNANPEAFTGAGARGLKTGARLRIPDRNEIMSAAQATPRKSLGQQSYGPIAPGQTLWSIAKELKPDDSISMEQMLLALQRANPQAFSSSTISSLKVGARLRVPTREEITQINPSAARGEVRRQLENE